MTHSRAHWPGAMVCSCSWGVPARTSLPSPAVNRLVCKRLLLRRAKVKALQPPPRKNLITKKSRMVEEMELLGTQQGPQSQRRGSSQ